MKIKDDTNVSQNKKIGSIVGRKVKITVNTETCIRYKGKDASPK